MFDSASARTSPRAGLSRVPLALARTSSRLNIWHHKVLCLPRTGYGDVPQGEHINGGPFFEGSLAAKGEALIHGPSLVARPVGSEWRTRRPHQESIQSNQVVGDQV